MQSLTVFLDASVVLSGLISPTGGSGKLLKAGSQKKMQLVVTEKIVLETVRQLRNVHVRHKTFERVLSSRGIRIVSTPSEERIVKFLPVIDDPDDAHVLAGAVSVGSDILVSLDKKHILKPNIREALKPIKVYSPKEFWAWMEKSV
jgi:putative PIN family toxin of toxin-antitoxin system